MNEWGSVAASLCVLLACGLPIRAAAKRIGIPPAVSLMGMGVILGPQLLGWLPASYLVHAPTLAKAAFVVLLLRVGLSIALGALKGRVLSVAALGAIPAMVELSILAVATYHFLFHRWDLALLAGFLIVAVSPAVILPTILDQKDKGRGIGHLVPDQIMSMAVLNAFLAQTGILILLEQIASPNAGRDITTLLLILPLSIGGGVAGGFAVGHAVSIQVSRLRQRGRPGWLFGTLVIAGATAVYFSAYHFGLESVFATLAVGVAIRRADPLAAELLRESMRKVWGVAEVFLFAGVGAMLELSSLTRPALILGFLALLTAALCVRMLAAWLCTMRTDLQASERLYTSLAQIPKATVQAVFGPVVFYQLSSSEVGLQEEGQVLLLMAVLSILASAPIGAVVLDRWGGRLLATNDPP